MTQRLVILIAILLLIVVLAPPAMAVEKVEVCKIIDPDWAYGNHNPPGLIMEIPIVALGDHLQVETDFWRFLEHPTWCIRAS